MRIEESGRRPSARVAAICLISISLSGCGAAAVVGAAASVSAQAVKTTGKAAGTVTRAGIGGTRAAARLATRPFRRKKRAPEPEPETRSVHESLWQTR